MAILLGIVCAFTEAHMGVNVKATGQYAFVLLCNVVHGFT